MITITTAVERILTDDGLAREAMSRGLLNMSAYATSIHQQVEEITMKPVKLGTIVVALTRLAQRMNAQDFIPHVQIENFSVISHLIDITYERTAETTARLQLLPSAITDTGEFFTATEGLHEITIIASRDMEDRVLNLFGGTPKALVEDLVAVSVRFSDEYLNVPNTIYALVGTLALRNINIMEIVSTYTELTFVIYASELESAIQALQTYNKVSL